MNLTPRGRLFLAIATLSFIFSYLIVTPNYFPHFGMATSLATFALFSYKYKQDKSGDTKLYLTFSLLFSLLIFIRSELFTTFLNLVAAVFFGFLMLLPAREKNLGFADYIYAPILFAFKSVLERSNYYLEFEKGRRNFGRIKIGEVAVGILITLFLLIIVLPLLSTTNPFFQKIVLDFWNFIKLENLIKLIGPETLFTWLIRAVFFFSFIFIIPKVLALINKTANYSFPLPFKKEELPLLIPKVILVFVLIVFFITQIQFYFATDAALSGLGVSHSQRTREVFTQLSLVAGILMLLIYNSREKSGLGRSLIWILGVQGIFLTLMAFKSDFEYINAWGLTYKRLYGLTFVTWITGIFLLFFNDLRQKKEPLLFARKTIIFSGILVLAIGALNFDYLIYHFQKARTGQGTDYTYLSMLSADSLSYREQIAKLEEASGGDGYSLGEYDNKNPLMIIRKIENLKRKYSKFDLRTLNLLDYLQFREIKSQETDKLRALYEKKTI